MHCDRVVAEQGSCLRCDHVVAEEGRGCVHSRVLRYSAAHHGQVCQQMKIKVSSCENIQSLYTCVLLACEDSNAVSADSRRTLVQHTP